MTESAKQSEKVSTDLMEARLLNQLDFEINLINNLHKRPGWNQWLLVGAIASLLWVLLGLVEAHGQAIKFWDVVLVAQVLLIAWGFVVGFVGLLGLKLPAGHSNLGFWFLDSLLAPSRPSILLQIVFCSALAIASFMNPLLHGTWCRWVLAAHFTLDAGLACFCLVLSFLRIPFGLAWRPKFPKATLTAQIAAPLWPAFLLVLLLFAIAKNWAGLIMPELRIAGLILCLIQLLNMLVAVRAQHPFLPALLLIRRRFCLGSLDFAAAKQQTEVLLQGMKSEAALEEYAKDALATYADAPSEFVRLENEVQSVVVASKPQQSEAQPNQPGGSQIQKAQEFNDRLAELDQSLEIADDKIEWLTGIVAGMELFSHHESKAMRTVLAVATKAQAEARSVCAQKRIMVVANLTQLKPAVPALDAAAASAGLMVEEGGQSSPPGMEPAALDAK